MSLIKQKITRLLNSNVKFEEFNILSEKDDEKDDEKDERTYNESPKMILNQPVVESLYTTKHKNIKIVLPSYNNQKFTLLLNEVDFYSPSYLKQVGAVINRHYSGIVEGVENSFVTLSVFKNDIACIIKFDCDTLELYKNGQNEYTYNRPDTMPNFRCGN